MKKIIKLEIENTTRVRSTENTYCEIYSHDKNNGYFEFEIMNEYLTVERPMAVFKFMESRKVWKTEGVLDKNKIKVTFDTDLITQEETVVCFLYLDEDQRTSDVHRFKFKVNLSEIDKLHAYETKERYIKDTIIVDRTDVVTKEDLKEALKNIETGNISTVGLLTEVKAEELYAKKTEAVDNTNFELVKNRVLALELKTDKDTVYNDSELRNRVEVLENKPPVDLSGYATKEELRTASGSQLPVDNLVTKEELENKHYISDVSNLATKEELQEFRNSQPTVDTSHLVTRDELEAKGYVKDLSEYAKKSELYNDTPLKERVTALESKAIEGGAYDDSDLRNRVVALEGKEDKDTKYDDSDLRNRVTNLENKPPLDTSEFVTNQALESKGYIKDVSNLVTKDELEGKHYISDISDLVTKEELESKGYLKIHQNLDNVVTKEELATKGYISDVSNLVTKEELESKNYLTTPYNDTPLKERVEVLENKVDKDTVYNDTELRNRVEALERKPNVALSNYVTNEQLENKHYLTQHQELTHLATTSDLEVLRNISVNKAELSKKLDTTEFNTFKDNVVTKSELAEKGYISDLSNYVTKEELHEATEIDYSNIVTTDELEPYVKKSELPTPYNDSALVSRVSALEDRPIVNTSNFATKQELQEATRGIKRSGIKTALVIGWKEIYIENMRFTSTMNLIDSTSNDNLRNINNLEIRRINNATSGYIIYNNKTKGFTLEVLETDLTAKTADDYLVAVMWNNNYYTENGVLKNKPKPIGKINPNTRIVTLGDSITQGLKNYNSPRELFSKAWTHYMLDSYGGSLRNIAVSGKSISGTGAEDFNGQVNSVNFNDFDLAIIAMGVNDFNNQSNLTDVVASLKKGLNKIFTDNKNIQVAGILPHNLFRLPFTRPANTVYVDGMKFADRNGKTLNDFCNAIASVYDEYQIPYIDWRKAPVLTMRNYNKWTWDAIHPNEAGHALIGRRVAEWLKVNV